MLLPEDVSSAAQAAGLSPASIVIRNLSGGAPGIAIEPDRYFYPASMLKTPLAVVALTLVDRGEVAMDQTFTVTQANLTANDKVTPFVLGYTGPLREIIEFAITHSDNVATNMLFDICNRERATAMIQNEYGLRHTGFYRKLSGSEPLIVDPLWDNTHRNAHSAGDAAKLFEMIARDEVPFAAELREILAKQQFNDKLSPGLRAGDRFEHKTGDTDEVTHDGGILRTGTADYVIVVYTGLESTPEHNARFGPFMAQIRRLL
jgi:beta-lactamase class A